MRTTLCFLVLVSLMMLQACRGIPQPPRTIENCPAPPTPQCFPTPCTRAAFDTSTASSGTKTHTWVIAPVEGLDSRDEEWSVTFRSEQTAFATKGKANFTFMYAAKFSHPRRAQLIEQIQTGFEGAQGSACFHKDGLFFGVYGVGRIASDADIYEATKAGNDMKNSQRVVPVSRDNSWEGHPALTPDGKIMFFASDRSGGFGGVDIWFVRKQGDGRWSDPVNAGPVINTACDELSPFVESSGDELFFASSGHDSYGGYDIFRTPLSSTINDPFATANPAGLFLKVENVGAPLNTTADEIFPSSPGDPEKLLYYSSNQRTNTGFDIFVRQLVPLPKPGQPRTDTLVAQSDPEPPPPPPPVRELPKTDSVELTGHVYNKKSEVIPGAEVKARDTEKNTILTSTTTNDSGAYRLKVPTDKDVDVTAQYEEGFYDNYKKNFPSRDTLTHYKQDFVVPEILYLRINFPTDIFLDPYERVLDSNGVETTQRWNESLDLVSENFKRFSSTIKRVILIGHTDEVGTNEYNQQLGQRRVNFVVDQLVRRGVPRTLLEPRSAGELQPLPRRKDEPMESYYKRNRRVELSKIMK